MPSQIILHSMTNRHDPVSLLSHGILKVRNNLGTSTSTSTPLSAVHMKDHRNRSLILYHQPADTAQPIVNTDYVEDVTFLPDQSIKKLRNAQNVVDEHVTEKPNVRAPPLQVISYKQRKNVTRIRNQRTMHFNTSQNLLSL
jgi:putative NIF3 family GTP cyclohydrolase 1 type 2